MRHNYAYVPHVTPYDFRNKERCVQNYVFQMLNRTQSMFRYDGLPETIPQRDMELLQQSTGYIGVIEYRGDLYALQGGLGGTPNPYYMPTEFIVANPALDLSKTYTIGKDCVIIPNDSMYQGIMPIMQRYATMLVENDLTMMVADINSRITTILSAGDERTQKSALQYLEDVEKGKLGVIIEPKFMEEVTGLQANTYSASGTASSLLISLIEIQQYLKGSFFMELGVKSPFNMKREALGDSENGLQDASLLPLIDDMLKQRQEGWEKVNEMFGSSVRVDLASAWEDIEEEAEHQTEEEQEETEEKEEEETDEQKQEENSAE